MAKEQLSDKQQQILEFIKRRILDKGYPPAVREICEAVNLRSTSSPFPSGDFGEKRIHS